MSLSLNFIKSDNISLINFTGFRSLLSFVMLTLFCWFMEFVILWNNYEGLWDFTFMYTM